MKKLLKFANDKGLKVAKIKYNFQGLTSEVGYSLFKDDKEYIEIKPCSKSFIDKRKYIVMFGTSFKYVDNISQAINVLKTVDLNSLEVLCFVSFSEKSILG